MRILIVTLAILASAGAVLFYRDGRLNATLTGRPAEYVAAMDQPAGETDYLRILVAGDVGTDDWRQRRVSEAMEALCARPGGVDQVLLLGDLFYDHGVTSVDDDRWRSGFREMYTGGLNEVTFRPVSGNHDLDGNLDALVEYSKIDERWAMEGQHYSFVRPLPSKAGEPAGEVAFFALDTTAMVVSKEAVESELAWLAAELAQCTSTWRVVFAHHPIDSGGSHGGEPILIERLVPLLREERVDLYLAGHDHYQAHLETKGLNEIVTGAGGKVRDASWTPTTRFASTKLGFTELLFSESEVYLRLYESSGELLYSKRVEKSLSPGT